VQSSVSGCASQKRLTDAKICSSGGVAADASRRASPKKSPVGLCASGDTVGHQNEANFGARVETDGLELHVRQETDRHVGLGQACDLAAGREARRHVRTIEVLLAISDSGTRDSRSS
jgi:hypothetical protein